MTPAPTKDPLLMTREDSRLDLKVGDEVEVGVKRGVVTGLCSFGMYPVKIVFDGDPREVRPIYHSINRALKLK